MCKQWRHERRGRRALRRRGRGRRSARRATRTRARPSPPRSSARASPSLTARWSTSRFRRSRAISAPAPPSCPGRSTPISCRSARSSCSVEGLAITSAGGGCSWLGSPSLPSPRSCAPRLRPCLGCWPAAACKGWARRLMRRTAWRSSAPRSSARRGTGDRHLGGGRGAGGARPAYRLAGRHDRLADDLPSQPADRRGCRLSGLGVRPREQGRARCDVARLGGRDPGDAVTRPPDLVAHRRLRG